MRILNKRQLQNIPMVDSSNLFLGEFNEDLRVRAQKDEAIARARSERAKQRLSARKKYEEYQASIAAAKHAQVLKNSLKQDTRKYQAAMSGRPDFGFVPKFGNNTPLMGFVDSLPTTLKDFSQREVYPAQDFCNTKTAKDFVGYTQFKDFPLVDDAKGDFGGILKTEAGSVDFSQMIVDDVKSDFGYVPRRRRR